MLQKHLKIKTIWRIWKWKWNKQVICIWCCVQMLLFILLFVKKNAYGSLGIAWSNDICHFVPYVIQNPSHLWILPICCYYFYFISEKEHGYWNFKVFSSNSILPYRLKHFCSSYVIFLSLFSFNTHNRYLIYVEELITIIYLNSRFCQSTSQKNRKKKQQNNTELLMRVRDRSEKNFESLISNTVSIV